MSFWQTYIEHQAVDKNSAMVANFKSKDLKLPKLKDFTILARNYPNRLKRQIAESLYKKENKPP